MPRARRALSVRAQRSAASPGGVPRLRARAIREGATPGPLPPRVSLTCAAEAAGWERRPVPGAGRPDPPARRCPLLARPRGAAERGAGGAGVGPRSAVDGLQQL